MSAESSEDRLKTARFFLSKCEYLQGKIDAARELGFPEKAKEYMIQHGQCWKRVEKEIKANKAKK
jgi:hypothetical protein